jgi:hypothetical protein
VKGNLNPAVAVVIILAVLGVAAWVVFRATGPRTDGPTEPIDMRKMMSQGQVNPGATGSGGAVDMRKMMQPPAGATR